MDTVTKKCTSFAENPFSRSLIIQNGDDTNPETHLSMHMFIFYIYRTLTQSEEGEDPLQHDGRLEPPPHGHVKWSKVNLHGQVSETEPNRGTCRSERSIRNTELSALGSKSAFSSSFFFHTFYLHVLSESSPQAEDYPRAVLYH